MADETQEEQYSARNQDLGIIRRSVDMMGLKLGEMNLEMSKMSTALKGDDVGNYGVVPRLKILEEEQKAIRENVKELLRAQKSREKLLLAIYTLGGILVSTLIRAIFEYLTKAKT